MLFVIVFFFQAEDGIRDLVRSRGLGDVYKRQDQENIKKVGLKDELRRFFTNVNKPIILALCRPEKVKNISCLLYTSDAADERSSVDLGGRRIIKKKKKKNIDSNRGQNKQKKESNNYI